MTMSERRETDIAPRLLVLGQERPELETVMDELRDLGLAVSGSVRPERAVEEFDALDFDLVAFGRGVDAVVRAGAKAAFARRNPAIRLVDTDAPVAARQICGALNGTAAAGLVDLDAYFARIGYHGPSEASLDVLKALHERHPDAIVFEALDVLAGRGIDLAPEAVDAKLIGARRGGYCFEHNSLFARVLEAMGFTVERLSARVRWGQLAGTAPRARTHMALRVTLDGAAWLADVGFGSCVPTTPLRMDTTDAQPTGHETFRIFAFGSTLMLQVSRDDRWLPVYELFEDLQYDADLEAANWFTATHPMSHFRQTLIAARTTREARHGLLGNRLTVRRPDGAVEQALLDANGIETVLADTFGLTVEPEWRPMIARAATAGG